MCRFVFYQGEPLRISSLVIRPTHSLVRQSFSSKYREQGILNGDGFGLAWYNHSIKDEPALFRSITPAWNDHNLNELADAIDSTCILAHIRAATQAFPVSEANCHPFKQGRFSFMHNGDIGDFAVIRRDLLGRLSQDAFQLIKGNTDSEHLFALIMNRLLIHQPIHAGRMVEAVKGALTDLYEMRAEAGIRSHCDINAVLTDGITSLVMRYSGMSEQAPSLFINSGNRYVCDAHQCYMVDPGYETKSVIVSSEPLGQDPGWKEVPVNALMVIHDGQVDWEEIQLEMTQMDL